MQEHIQVIVNLPSLREKSPYSELFSSAFSRIGTEYREIRSISPCSVWMRENVGQNNSEYKHFSRSACLRYNTGKKNILHLLLSSKGFMKKVVGIQLFIQLLSPEYFF